MNNIGWKRFARVQYLALALLVIALFSFARLPAQAASNTIDGMNSAARGADLPSALPSATVFVTSTNDSGDGSLRSVMAAANPGDTINFDLSGCPCTIGLSSELVINQSLNIVGLGQSMLAVNGNGSVRVFNKITADPVTISNLTIENGHAGTGNSGGGIRTQTPITVTNVIFSGNSAGLNGGAIYNEGGAVVVMNSTFTSNSATSGGGISNYSGTTRVYSSTFESNSGSNIGGAIHNRDILVVANATFSSNTSSAGTAIGNEFSGNAAVTNSTLYVASGLNIFNVTGIPSGIITVTNTIVANGTSANCASGITNGGHNIDTGSSCGFGSDNGSMSSTNPLLGSLADNGGSTQTYAIAPGSPALDAGDDSVCTSSPVNSVDQRRKIRPIGVHCDIGSFEFGYFLNLPLIVK